MNTETSMRTPSTRDVVEKIQCYLGNCTQKVICRYLGVSNVALSQNIEREFATILDNKVGKRLDALLYVLECAKKDQSLEAGMLHRLLTLPAQKDRDGWKIDVISAIHQDDQKEMLVEIFQSALHQLRKTFDKAPVSGGLYSAIHD